MKLSSGRRSAAQQWSSGKVYAPGGPSMARREAFCFWTIFFILGDAMKLRWVGGGAQRPVWLVNEPKKTGAHARARAAITH